MDAFDLTDPAAGDDAVRQVLALIQNGPGVVPQVGAPQARPSGMSGGMPPSPMPQPPAIPQGPAKVNNWKQLIQMVGPVLAAAAMKGPQQTGFLNGWAEGQQLVTADKERKRQEALRAGQSSANFVMDVQHQLDQYSDPVQWAQHLDVAKHAAQTAGLDASALDGVQFNKTKQAQAVLKELTEQLDKLEKGGYNLDELAQSGAHVRLPSSGLDLPITSAVQLTQARPMSAGGTAVAKPPKIGNTEEERFIAKRAKDYGYTTIEDVDADTQLQWRQDFRDAGRADKVDKTPAVGGVDAQFNDLVALWKESHPNQEPPAAVRTKLRKEANSVNDKAPTGFGGAAGPAGNSALDPDGIDYAATEYRVTGKMPALGMGNGAARAAIINGAAKQARTLGQTPAAAIQKQAAFKADAGSLNRITSMSAAAESFENKALAQADIIDQLSAKVPRSQWPAINGAIMGGKINLLGDSNAKQLANAVETFSAEYAKIIEGSTGSAAGSSDSSRKASARLIDTSLNKGTMTDVLNLMRREMRLTVQGYDATKAHITERMGGKVPDTQGGAPGGAGASYKLVNGQWVKQ